MTTVGGSYLQHLTRGSLAKVKGVRLCQPQQKSPAQPYGRYLMVKMRFAWLSVTALLIGLASVQADEKPTEEDYARVQASLAEMECEMDPADIAKVDGGFKL